MKNSTINRKGRYSVLKFSIAVTAIVTFVGVMLTLTSNRGWMKIYVDYKHEGLVFTGKETMTTASEELYDLLPQFEKLLVKIRQSPNAGKPSTSLPPDTYPIIYAIKVGDLVVGVPLEEAVEPYSPKPEVVEIIGPPFRVVDNVTSGEFSPTPLASDFSPEAGKKQARWDFAARKPKVFCEGGFAVFEPGITADQRALVSKLPRDHSLVGCTNPRWLDSFGYAAAYNREIIFLLQNDNAH